jgi:hypothetical protein
VSHTNNACIANSLTLRFFVIVRQYRQAGGADNRGSGEGNCEISNDEIRNKSK